MKMTDEDIALFEREPELPGLPVLLDGDRLGRDLASRLGVRNVELEPNYVRLKPGVNCLVGYRISADGLPQTGYAKVFASRDRPKLHKAATSFKRLGLPDSSSLLLEDLLTVFYFFPNDMRLRSLAVLLNRDTRKDLLDHLFGEKRDPASVDLVPIAYKPERRYVARFQTPDGDAFAVKLYLPADFDRAKTAAKQVVRRSGVSTAALVGNSDRYKALSFEWLAGRSLTDRLRSGTYLAEISDALGAALARLHKSDVGQLKYRSTRLVLRVMEAATSSAVQLMPELSDEVASTRRALSRSLEKCSISEPVPIHGDFYSDQVLVEDGGISLLDFDNAVFGSLESDVANLLAHLVYDVVRGHLPEGIVPEVREHLIQAYSDQRLPMDELSLDLLTSASLLQLLPQPFRSREDRWPELMHGILNRATALAQKRRPDLKSIARGMPGENERWTSIFSEAMDVAAMDQHLKRSLRDQEGSFGDRLLTSARVLKHRPGRRCVIEYELSDGRTILGKTRAKGFDYYTCSLQETLWKTDFGPTATDNVFVAEPLGRIPELNMWLQRKLDSPDGWNALCNGSVSDCAYRLAEVIAKLQRAGPTTERIHLVEKEIEILIGQFSLAREERPELDPAISELESGCRQLADMLAPWSPVPVHRDFYPDNVLMDGRSVWLLDLDLYCLSHPALDAGNYLGHIWEALVRRRVGPETAAEFERVFLDRLSEESGRDLRFELEAFAVLTLSRHVAISQRIQARKPFSEDILASATRRLRSLVSRSVAQGGLTG